MGGVRAMKAKLTLRFVALTYLTLLIALPVALVARNAFGSGVAAFWNALTQPAAMSAFVLTVKIVAVVVPLNTVFGVICALVLVRQHFFGSTLLGALVNVPVAISPIVVGLSLFIIYGRGGWLGTWLIAHGLYVLFAVPGMILATIFISLPFVVREVVPVLREIGSDQEEAARTLGASSLQTFWRITLPAIRTGVAYGVVLTTARALGEFGAVSIVSGHLSGQTETLTLYVQDRFEQFDLVGAYTASVVLAALALAVLGLMTVFGRERTADVN